MEMMMRRNAITIWDGDGDGDGDSYLREMTRHDEQKHGEE